VITGTLPNLSRTKATEAVEQAGGRVTELDGQALRYNTKASLLNPDFLAYGDARVDWAALLRGTAHG